MSISEEQERVRSLLAKARQADAEERTRDRDMHLREALNIEMALASRFEHRKDLEPARGHLFARSAELAYMLGDIEIARQLVEAGLSGVPFDEEKVVLDKIARLTEINVGSYENIEAAEMSSSTHLDESQRRFVESTATNIRLLAPAGCGKTLSLLHRCLFLADQARPAKPRFLIVTFTVAARAELLLRLSEDPAFVRVRDQVTATTLNSYGFNRIKNSVTSPKLLSTKADFHFAMLNQLRPVWTNYKAVQEAVEGKKKNTLPKQLMALIDEFKSVGFDHIRHQNQEKFLERINELREQGLEPRLQSIIDDLTKADIIPVKKTRKGEEIARASDRELYSAFFMFWRDAIELLHASATFTLEDQKYYAYQDELGKLEKGSFLSGAAKHDYILVDEFQDINPLDLAFIKAIADRNKAPLTIVGDDDQAIFEWRGATPEYILNPQKYFGREFTTSILDTNYRSPKNIVEKSKTLIEHNERRVKKDIKAHRTDEAAIETIRSDGLNEALDFVYDIVRQAVDKNQSPARVAIIGRKKSQIIPYQIFLASKNVSFCAAEDLQVFMSTAFDRLLELLMIRGSAASPAMSMEVVERTLKLCDLVKRWPLARAEKEELKRFLVSSRFKSVAEAAEGLAAYEGNLKGSNAALKMSSEFSEALLAFLEGGTVSEALLAMGERFEGLQIDLGKAEDDIFYVDPPFMQLAEFAQRYGRDFNAFVNDIELAREQLAHVPPYEEDDEVGDKDELWRRPIHLMTALRAKGKEFDTVILLDVNDGIWPSKRAKMIEEKEAERRVFYVAFTRAKQRLIMLVAQKFNQKVASASQYLDEIEGILVLKEDENA